MEQPVSTIDCGPCPLRSGFKPHLQRPVGTRRHIRNRRCAGRTAEHVARQTRVVGDECRVPERYDFVSIRVDDLQHRLALEGDLDENQQRRMQRFHRVATIDGQRCHAIGNGAGDIAGVSARWALLPARPRRPARARCAVITGKSLFPDRSGHAGRPLRPGRALLTGRTSRPLQPFRPLRPLWTLELYVERAITPLWQIHRRCIADTSQSSVFKNFFSGSFI